MPDSSEYNGLADLQTDVRRVLTDLSNLTKTIGDISQSQAAIRTESLRRAGDHAAERLQAVAAKAGSLTDAGLEATGRQIAEHPVTSLLVAFSAGLVFGKLVERR